MSDINGQVFITTKDNEPLIREIQRLHTVNEELHKSAKRLDIEFKNEKRLRAYDSKVLQGRFNKLLKCIHEEINLGLKDADNIVAQIALARVLVGVQDLVEIEND
jgi:hypothetical protein